jgi:Zn-dependent protease/CBS domain-containing protein
MAWSWNVGQIAGIRIYLHWTFLLLVAWIFGSYVAQGQTIPVALVGVGFILCIFVCILLHELGHALTARRYGIKTKDIILLPIGGVARLERMPEQPLQELAVAAAGPAVNVVIAVVLGAILLAFYDLRSLAMDPTTKGSFLLNLVSVNLFLVIFNLIPAFPMDGGRMLRALLAMRMPYQRATNIAASIGQFLAIGFAFVGLFWLGNPMLLFIALFVYLGAGAEARLTEVRTLLRDVPVRDAMISRFHTLRSDDPLQRAVDELLAGWQTDFPVVDDGVFLGMLRRADLAEALQQGGPASPVSEAMQTDCPSLTNRDLLERVMGTLQTDNCTTLPVLENGRLVGLLTNQNLGELMMVRSALSGQASTNFLDADNL